MAFDKLKSHFKKTKNNVNLQRKSFMDVTNTYLRSEDKQKQNQGRRRLMYHMFVVNSWAAVKWFLYDAIWILFVASFINNANMYIDSVYNASNMSARLLNAAMGQQMNNAALIAGSFIVSGYAIVKHGLIKWPYGRGSFNAYIEALDEAKQEPENVKVNDHELRDILEIMNNPMGTHKNRRYQFKLDLINTYGATKANILYKKYANAITKDGHINYHKL